MFDQELGFDNILLLIEYFLLFSSKSVYFCPLLFLALTRPAARLLLGLEMVDAGVGEKDGYTPLHGAGFQGRAEIARLLLEDARNLDPNSFHEDGFAPLHRACWGREQRHADTIRRGDIVQKICKKS